MEILEDSVWQMSVGERAAFEGFLTQVAPDLAIEIGTAEGASLRRIAAHAKEVHSFDLVAPSLDLPDHVTLHLGDSHEELPKLLNAFAAQGRNVDFALVDGDHSAEGVRRDIEDLLDSDAVQRTVILIHDVNHEQVRRGVDAVRYREWRKVVSVELDCVPGYISKEPGSRNQLWGGLGFVLVDVARPAYGNPEVYQQRYHDAAPLMAAMRDELVAQDESRTAGGMGALHQLRKHIAALEVEAADARAAEETARAAEHTQITARRAVEGSFSWKVTRPLRHVKSRVRQLL